MADPVSGIAHSALSQQLDGQKLQQQQQQQGAGGRSFESVLQQQQSTGNPSEAQSAAASRLGQPAPVSGAQIERMQLDLMDRVGRLPPGSPNVNALLPELLTPRVRMGMLRDAMSKMGGGGQTATDLRGRFGQIEGELKQLDAIMMSSKDLSQGELLALQARLYQVTQHVEVLSKVVDQVTGGVKTILNTNV